MFVFCLFIEFKINYEVCIDTSLNDFFSNVDIQCSHERKIQKTDYTIDEKRKIFYSKTYFINQDDLSKILIDIENNESGNESQSLRIR